MEDVVERYLATRAKPDQDGQAKDVFAIKGDTNSFVVYARTDIVRRRDFKDMIELNAELAQEYGDDLGNKDLFTDSQKKNWGGAANGFLAWLEQNQNAGNWEGGDVKLVHEKGQLTAAIRAYLVSKFGENVNTISPGSAAMLHSNLGHFPKWLNTKYPPQPGGSRQN